MSINVNAVKAVEGFKVSKYPVIGTKQALLEAVNALPDDKGATFMGMIARVDNVPVTAMKAAGAEGKKYSLCLNGWIGPIQSNQTIFLTPDMVS